MVPALVLPQRIGKAAAKNIVILFSRGVDGRHYLRRLEQLATVDTRVENIAQGKP
jgi:hypothetical protein